MVGQEIRKASKVYCVNLRLYCTNCGIVKNQVQPSARGGAGRR
ncbi:hypothetical protein MCA0125 [Methylococcus capsulatus str. Bath]|uniref:Uncharacterized protein n=1 Tax=Methylococcus capsulatus (strain ATCC 33009 / NCIMB 11132 / Bath) TaxID=243233 RepID=Q60CI1_METCA|nr:hypothetical protein MCA0125 [Methylococcus capsulatus str. Bath]